MLCLACLRSRTLSSCPVTIWNRRLNNSCLYSLCFSTSSASDSSRSSPTFALAMSDLLAGQEAAFHGQLVRGKTQGLAGHVLGDARDLEHHASRLHNSHPALRRPL